MLCVAFFGAIHNLIQLQSGEKKVYKKKQLLSVLTNSTHIL